MAVKNGIGLESDQVEHIGSDGEIERGGRAENQEEIFHFVFPFLIYAPHCAYTIFGTI